MFTSRLISKKQLIADIWSFTFEVPNHFEWCGGQHSVLILEHANVDERGTSRALSISSLPFEHVLQFITHCPEQGSSFKHALRNLEVGAEISLTPAQSSFAVEFGEEPAILIAGGVGVASIRSLVVERHHNKKAVNAKLYYYASQNQHVFVDDLDNLAQKDKSFSVHYLTQEGLQEQGGIKEADEIKGTTYYYSGVYTREMLESSELEEHIAGPASEERKEVELLSKAVGLLKGI